MSEEDVDQAAMDDKGSNFFYSKCTRLPHCAFIPIHRTCLLGKVWWIQTQTSKENEFEISERQCIWDLTLTTLSWYHPQIWNFMRIRSMKGSTHTGRMALPLQTSWNLPSLECKDDGQDKRNLLLDRGVGIAYDNGSWLPPRDGQQAPLTVLRIAKVMLFTKYPKPHCFIAEVKNWRLDACRNSWLRLVF